jgi:hypothetical protein
VDGADLLLTAGVTSLVAVAGIVALGRHRQRRATVVRWLSLAVVGGMAGYLLYALRIVRPETWGLLPEAAWVARAALAALTATGALLPLAVVIRTADGQNERV